MKLNKIDRLLQRIRDRQQTRDWGKLPAQFEHDAVKLLFKAIKPEFDPVDDIRLRIAASKATTFAELRAVFQAALAKGASKAMSDHGPSDTW